MLTGKELGAAIESARLKKGISKTKLAGKFGVKPPSVQGWVNFGRIDKSKLMELISYFSDTVGPEHWGFESDLPEYLKARPALADSEAHSGAEAFSFAPLSCAQSNAALMRIIDAAARGRLTGPDLDFLASTAAHLESRNPEALDQGRNVTISADSAKAKPGLSIVGGKKNALDSDPSVVVSIPHADASPAATDWDEFAFIDQYDAKAAAGSGYDNTHVVLRNTLAFKRDWLRIKGVKPKNLKVIYADGNSMWPTITDHDVLLVDESRIEPADGHIFVIESQDRGTIVKRLVKSDFDGWIIRSDNPDKINFPDEVLPDGEIYEHRILGRVIWRGGDL